ncbi:molybdenum cofactor guanylyltransferase [Candidatus Nitrospira bockiana]
MATLKGVSGVLLAGGKSRRMGQDKRFLDLGGRTLLQRTLAVYEQLFEEIILVTAQEDRALADVKHAVVTDIIPDGGSMGGLYTGLFRATRERIFVAACDMPFLNMALIEYLAGFPAESDIVIVRLLTGLQPMHAVYGKACLPHFEEMLQRRSLAIHGVLSRPGLRVSEVPETTVRMYDPQLLSFLNINSPADLEFGRKLVKMQDGRE